MFFYLLLLLNYSILIIAKEELNSKTTSLILNYYESLIDLNDLDNIKNYNNQDIYENFTLDNQTRIFGEYILSKYYGLSFFNLFIGFFILLYGAHYYKIGLIFHSTMFIFYIFIFLLDFNYKESQDYYYLYILLFSFISGVVCRIFLGDNDKRIWQLIIYGACFGCFFFKSIIYYFILLNKKYKFSDRYLTIFFFSIIMGALSNVFIPLGDYAFLPNSIISGSYYIVNSFMHILNTNYTDFNLSNLPSNFVVEKGEFKTYLFIQIFLIIFAFFVQIIHLKVKELEDPKVIEKKALNQFIRESRLTINSDDINSSIQDKDSKIYILINKTLNNDESDEEEEIKGHENRV